MIDQEKPKAAAPFSVDSAAPRAPEARRVVTGLSTSLRDLAYVVFKWKFDIACVLVLAALGSAVYLFLIRGTLYETTSTLLVKLGQEQAPPTTMLGDRTLLISQRPEDVISETGVLKSTDLMRQVVTKLGLDRPAPPESPPAALLPWVKFEIKQTKSKAKKAYNDVLIAMGLARRLSPYDEAVYVMSKALVVEALPESNVVIASLRTPIPDGSSAILNGLIEEYLVFRRTVYMDDQSIEYFKQQVNSSEIQLKKAELAIASFEQENNFNNLSAQETLLLSRREDVVPKLNAAETDYNIAQQKQSRFKAGNSENSADFSSVGEFKENSYPDALMLELVQLSKEREELREGTGASAQQLIRIERQRAAVLSMLGNYLSSLENERRQNFDALRAEFDNLDHTLEKIRVAQTQWDELERALHVAQDNYYFYQKRLEESVAILAMQSERIGNVSVLQHAVDPAAPMGMSRVKLFLFGLVFAVFAALGWAAIREYFDHTLSTPEQLRRHVPAPVLASVPMARIRNYRR